MRKIKIGNKQVGESEPTFIIAEAGSNHNGKLKQAKKLIDIAADAGVDAVKFQLFKAARIYPKNCGVVDTVMGKVDFFKVLKNMELPLTWLELLKDYSEKKGLIFLCSCFDEKSADALENVGITAHKLGSPELNHIPLLEHLGKKSKPIILSTGLSKLGEIEEAIDTYYERRNKQVILLHCASAYPTPLEDCNLNVIKTLKIAFDVPVGFSDHTLNPIIAPVTAIAIGANVIEKHFTISKKLEGPDHSFALEPLELKKMVEEVRKIEKIKKKVTYVRELFGKEKMDAVLGTYKKMIAPSEKDIYPNDKRSIHAVQNIKKGDILTKENIMVLRSERNLNPGIHPRYYKLILGKKVSRDISYGKGVQLNDLLINGDNNE